MPVVAQFRTLPGQGSVATYFGAQQPISAVALTAPKAGVFRDVVEWVLVVCTVVEVQVLALCHESEWEIRSTGLCCAADNLTIARVAATRQGRIFLGAASDGALYELQYHGKTADLGSWIGETIGARAPSDREPLPARCQALCFRGPPVSEWAAKCRKVNLSVSIAVALLPPFLKRFSQPDALDK